MNGRHYEIRHFSRHLTAFCHNRGPVLTVAGRKRLFRFANPLLEPYVMLHALATGQITWNTLTRALGG